MRDTPSLDETVALPDPERGNDLESSPADRGNGLSPHDETNLPVFLEALLFVAPGEVSPAQLAAALGVSEEKVERGLEALAHSYQRQERGLRVQRLSGRVQLTTAPQMSGYVEAFLGLEATSRLSRAALETLAIVLYRQPVTRPQVDAIRGVNSDGVVRSLLLKGLIQEIGRADAPGRPILYSVTADCLQHFGLSSLADLPPLELDEASPPAIGQAEESQTASATTAKQAED